MNSNSCCIYILYMCWEDNCFLLCYDDVCIKFPCTCSFLLFNIPCLILVKDTVQLAPLVFCTLYTSVNCLIFLIRHFIQVQLQYIMPCFTFRNDCSYLLLYHDIARGLQCGCLFCFVIVVFSFHTNDSASFCLLYSLAWKREKKWALDIGLFFLSLFLF